MFLYELLLYWAEQLLSPLSAYKYSWVQLLPVTPPHCRRHLRPSPLHSTDVKENMASKHGDVLQLWVGRRCASLCGQENILPGLSDIQSCLCEEIQISPHISSHKATTVQIFSTSWVSCDKWGQEVYWKWHFFELKYFFIISASLFPVQVTFH